MIGDFVGQLILGGEWWVVLCVHHGLLSGILGLSPQDFRSILCSDSQNCCQTLPNVPGDKAAPAENRCSYFLIQF